VRSPMASELQYPFTQQQIGEQAQGNLNVAILGAMAYGKAVGQDARAVALFIGQRLVSEWAGITSPLEAATAMALNCASLGMPIVSITGDKSHGEAVTGDWPDPDLLQLMGISQAEADHSWDIFEPITQSLGYRFSFRRDGAQLHFTIAK
jgi:hypothetical protein